MTTRPSASSPLISYPVEGGANSSRHRAAFAPLAWRSVGIGCAGYLQSANYAQYMKGDRVEVVVAADDGSRTYEIVATRAGRRVEITTGRGIVEVVEVTRTGEPVRTARFMASRVVALVEHPASEAAAAARIVR